jgi:GT2 family glycosyltransferase
VTEAADSVSHAEPTAAPAVARLVYTPGPHRSDPVTTPPRKSGQSRPHLLWLGRPTFSNATIVVPDLLDPAPDRGRGRSKKEPTDMSELRALSIVIPSYNARALLRRTLRTLEVAAPEAEVIVVDGSSADGSAAMVAEEFPEVRLVSQPNHGFAHATNRGIERASRPFILLLNSDLFVTRAALEAMHSRLAADARLAAVSPKLVNEDGSKQAVFGAFYWPNWVDVQRASRVWLLSGACLMTRRDVIERVGALDESFFLYNEEYDWCARCRRAGYHLELVPESVVHVGGGSTSRSPALALEEQRGFLYFAQKHAPPAVAEGLRVAMHIEGFCFGRIDPRPEHRAMWAQLESLTRRSAFRESPFPLSGRGDSVAQPNGLPFVAPARPAAPDESGAHAMSELRAEPEARVVEARAEAETSNVLPLRRGARRSRAARAAG